MAFHDVIRRDERNIVALHRAVHATCRLRDRSDAHKVKWVEAARRFREYRSSVTELMAQCYKQGIHANQSLYDFAIDFLECDPMFFGSGYFKELVLNQMKQRPVGRRDMPRLRRILLHAANHCHYREYRRYCKLAAAMNDGELKRELQSLLDSDDARKRSRSRLMLYYIWQANHRSEAVNV